jgi:two-component system chemotaxis response regulator CheB
MSEIVYPATRHPDVIVIGASAGGHEALRVLLANLPADLPAAVFVTVHRGLAEPNHLAEVLARYGALPVEFGEEAQAWQAGRIYLAPNDRHLLVGARHVHVRRGARENRMRPAIDPLFRSAAANCSSRVIGILLSGMLDDGVDGLAAIKRCGGLTLVQEPEDAACDQLPRNAITRMVPDHVLPVRQMAHQLIQLTSSTITAMPEVPEDVRIEALVAAMELGDVVGQLGMPSGLTCPECHGALYSITNSRPTRYRCHTGHAYSTDVLRAAQAEALEQALFAALRAQEEQTILVRTMAEQAHASGDSIRAAQLRDRALGYGRDAEALRKMIGAGES